MNRNHAPEPARNSYGFPLADAPAYLPRERARDIPLPITMEEPTEENFLWALAEGLAMFLFVAMCAGMAYWAWVNWPVIRQLL